MNPNSAPFLPARLWQSAQALLCGLVYYLAFSTTRYPQLASVVQWVLAFVPLLFISGRYLLRKHREREASRTLSDLQPADKPRPGPAAG